MWPKQIPPTFAFMLGMMVMAAISVPGMYYYMLNSFDAEIQKTRADGIEDSENAASEIRETTDRKITNQIKYQEKVSNGEIKVVSDDGKYATPDATARLLHRLECARPESDCTD